MASCLYGGCNHDPESKRVQLQLGHDKRVEKGITYDSCSTFTLAAVAAACIYIAGNLMLLKDKGNHR